MRHLLHRRLDGLFRWAARRRDRLVTRALEPPPRPADLDSLDRSRTQHTQEN